MILENKDWIEHTYMFPDVSCFFSGDTMMCVLALTYT